ncbi:hypothetical protein NP05227_07930 [Helicobacter pylori]
MDGLIQRLDNDLKMVTPVFVSLLNAYKAYAFLTIRKPDGAMRIVC